MFADRTRAARTRKPSKRGAAPGSVVEPLEGRALFSVNFLPAVQLPTGASPYAIAKGDFDGDGRADVVTANVAGSLSVELSGARHPTPTGPAFPPGPCVNTSLPFHPIAVTAGDFDGDGRGDVVVISQVTSYNSAGQLVATNTAWFLHGLGDGHFAAPQVLPVATGGAAAPVQPNFVTSADFNGDGTADLALYDSADGSVRIYDGSTVGLVPAVRYAANNPGGARLATGDFNGDGKTDLVTVGEGNTVNLLLNQGDGTLVPAVHVAAPMNRIGAVAVGDFNGDGRADLALGGYYNDVHVFLTGAFGSGGGASFQLIPGAVTKYASPVAALAAGDFNGDGSADLAVGGPGFLSFQTGHGDGAFDAPVPVNPAAGPGPNALVVGDFDGDGSVDLATADTSHNAMDLYLNRAAPAPTITATGQNFAVAAGKPFTRPLCTFVDSLGNQAQSNYSATIDWGDGTVTQGLIASPANTHILDVFGTHTYAAAGVFIIHVTIKPAVGVGVSVDDVATVTNSPVTSPMAVRRK